VAADPWTDPRQPFPKSNDEIVRGVEGYAVEVVRALDGQEGDLFVETAGGKSLATHAKR
jgi:dethiobiotin synthetase/adenosylmethionine--8-amino-7-oxononanoate aminotransferase